VHVVVDETRNDRAPAKIDPPRPWSGHGRDLLVGPDRDDPITAHRDRLGDREFVVDGDDLPVGQNQIR
jgi:hypothetical protein